MQYSKKEIDENYQLAHRLRLAAEQREAKAHQVAAALDEVLALCLLALTQAANTGRGMQQRRAKRLASQFRSFRDRALDGTSPCQPGRKNYELDDEALENTDRLVR